LFALLRSFCLWYRQEGGTKVAFRPLAVDKSRRAHATVLSKSAHSQPSVTRRRDYARSHSCLDGQTALAVDITPQIGLPMRARIEPQSSCLFEQVAYAPAHSRSSRPVALTIAQTVAAVKEKDRAAGAREAQSRTPSSSR
jgi:hypothetical protein